MGSAHDDTLWYAQVARMNADSLLLPCPFCGGTASHSMGQTGDGKPWPYIECEECGACAEPDVWNKRAALSAGDQNG